MLLVVSDESKACCLYDTIAKRVIVSKDVIFEENKDWDWKRTIEEEKLHVLDWSEKDKEQNKLFESEEEAESDVDIVGTGQDARETNVTSSLSSTSLDESTTVEEGWNRELPS